MLTGVYLPIRSRNQNRIDVCLPLWYLIINELFFKKIVTDILQFVKRRSGFLKIPQWTFITNHGLVLAYIAKYPQSTTRAVASAINLTERTVHKIITELETEKYIERRRMGRNNVYRINSHTELRHETTRDVLVEDFLKVLGWRQSG